jgi:hypothetical protein
MAHFYASIQGNRGERTCMGTKNSGIEGHIRGWDIGGRIDVFYNAEKDRDEVRIMVSTGSNGSGQSKAIGMFYRKGEKIVKAH